MRKDAGPHPPSLIRTLQLAAAAAEHEAALANLRVELVAETGVLRTELAQARGTTNAAAAKAAGQLKNLERCVERS